MALDADTLTAIYDYIRGERRELGKYPTLLPVIQAFEKWAQGIDWITKSDLDEARRFKAQINDILKEHLPDTSIPADRPQTSPPASSSSIGIAVAVIAVALLLGFGFYAGKRL